MSCIGISAAAVSRRGFLDVMFMDVRITDVRMNIKDLTELSELGKCLI